MPDPVYHPYTEWEDWQAGMWQPPPDVTPAMEQAAHILTDPDLFRTAARAMLADWPNAAEHNLTTTLVNNAYSWVGQATCMHLAQVPESATRLAWWTLTPAEQCAANQVAAEVITEWQTTRDDLEHPGLFAIDSPTQSVVFIDDQERAASA